MKKNTIYILMVLIALFFSACEDWLEVNPGDGLTREDYWKSESQVNDAVVGCYSSMIESDNFIWYLFLWGELRSDMISASNGAEDWLREEINGTYTPNDPLTNWGMIYKTINQCNTVLEFAGDAMDEDKTFTIEKLNKYKAEVYGIRALMYFYLARVFGDVPLVTEASVSDDQDYFVEKSLQSAIIDQIKADLDTAIKYIPETYERVEYDKGRLTKYAIWAILADVYLWNEEFQKSSDFCDSIINSQNFGLVAGDNSWFQKLYVEGNSNEGIFELQYTAFKINETFFLNFMQGSEQKVRAAQTVPLLYFTPDEANPLLVDIRGNGGSLNTNNMSIWKYIGSSVPGAVKSINEATSNWTFYRYADVLLMKAEALNELNNGDQMDAFKYIEMVRARAKANDISSTSFNGDSTNVEQVARYILDERAREFAFEGKRWFDLLRYAKRNSYATGNRLNTVISIVTGNISPTKISTIVNKYRDVRSHYLPVNYSEILRNYKLVQNPFYDTTD